MFYTYLIPSQPPLWMLRFPPLSDLCTWCGVVLWCVFFFIFPQKHLFSGSRHTHWFNRTGWRNRIRRNIQMVLQDRNHRYHGLQRQESCCNHFSNQWAKQIFETEKVMKPALLIYYFKWKEINEDLRFHSSSITTSLPTLCNLIFCIRQNPLRTTHLGLFIL